MNWTERSHRSRIDVRRGLRACAGLPVFALLLLLAITSPSLADDSDPSPDLTVVTLSAADARAVIRGEDGRLQVKSVGDPLVGDDWVIQQIMPDRIVVLDGTDPSQAPTIVWVFKAGEDGRSRIERLERHGDTAPAVAPTMTGPGAPEAGPREAGEADTRR